MTILVYGSTGYIGSKVCNLLDKAGINYIKGTARLENAWDIYLEIIRHNPHNVLNLAGLTGLPNIDWCEDNKLETIRVNVVGTMNLIDICNQKDIHVTNYTTGCIYNNVGDKIIPFTEEDEPNWTTSFYSKTKAILESLSKEYNNVLNLRIRMPVDSDLNSPKNLITKLLKFDKVINVPNSITILDDMIPISVDMALKGVVGTFNFTNPGCITHNEILGLYKFHVDKSIQINNFSIEEQNKILKTGRCNCVLDTTKIERLYPLPNVRSSIERIIKNYTTTLEHS